ncbi:hypothetical protein [Mesorhizobium sp. M0130]
MVRGTVEEALNAMLNAEATAVLSSPNLVRGGVMMTMNKNKDDA